jgi:hypothetical protein
MRLVHLRPQEFGFHLKKWLWALQDSPNSMLLFDALPSPPQKNILNYVFSYFYLVCQRKFRSPNSVNVVCLWATGAAHARFRSEAVPIVRDARSWSSGLQFASCSDRSSMLKAKVEFRHAHRSGMAAYMFWIQQCQCVCVVIYRIYRLQFAFGWLHRGFLCAAAACVISCMVFCSWASQMVLQWLHQGWDGDV